MDCGSHDTTVVGRTVLTSGSTLYTDIPDVVDIGPGTGDAVPLALPGTGRGTSVLARAQLLSLPPETARQKTRTPFGVYTREKNMSLARRRQART